MRDVLGIGWDVGGWYGDNHGICLAAVDVERGRLTLPESPHQENPRKLSLDLSSSREVEPDPLAFFSRRLGFEKNRWNEYDGVVLAVDAPLAFPKTFREFLIDQPGGAGETWNLPGEAHLDSPYYYRDCERWVYSVTGKKPQPAVGSWIGNNATVAQLLVDRWRVHESWRLCPQDGSLSVDGTPGRSIIEVYPGTLKQTSGDDKRLKPLVRDLLPEGFTDRRGIDDDRTDAMLCALHALVAAGGYNSSAGLRTRDQVDQPVRGWEFPREEGWIYVFEDEAL